MPDTTITALDLVTPNYDRTLGEPFKGSHYGYRVTVTRKGDAVTVEHFGCKGIGPVRPLLQTEEINIPEFLKDLESQYKIKIKINFVDDLPEGFTVL